MRNNAKKARQFFILWVASLLIAAGLCPLSAFAASPAAISLGSASTAVAPGREFTVPVTITDNPGFTAAILELTYDHEVLEPVRLVTTGMLTNDTLDYDFNSADTIGYLSDSRTNMTRNGVLFSVTFKVKEGVATGGYTYSARLYQSLSKNFIDEEIKMVAVEFQAGAVQVAPQSSGGGGTGGTGGGGTGGTGAGTGGAGAGAGGAGAGAGADDADTDTGADATTDTGQNIPNPQPPLANGDTSTGQDIPDTDTPRSSGAEEGFDISALPWGWILLLLALLIGGLMFFLLNRRRKDEDEDE